MDDCFRHVVYRENVARYSSSCKEIGARGVIGCLHDPANVQHYICWKFAGRLLDRVNTPIRFKT